MKNSVLALLFITACSQLPVEAPKKVERKANPYPRIEANIQRVCAVSQELDGYEERFIFDCKQDYTRESRIFAGYGFRSKSGHPHTSGVRSPYRRGKVARSIDMISRNHALNETYLHVIDFAGGPDSHDIKSVIYLFPRTDIPSVTEAGNEIELILPTGERVSFDADTGAIKGGAMREGRIDLNANYRKRNPPNVHYTGDYVSVRLDHAYEEPAIAADTALVTQKEKSCRIPRSKLFNRQGKLLTRSDEELLEVLNRECQVTFEF